MIQFSQIKSYKYFLHIVIIIAIIFLFTSYRIYIWSNTQSTDNAYIEADISEISSEINGIIDEVLVNENNRVKKNQIIARIKNDDYKALYEKAKSATAGAKHKIQLIEQNIELALIDESKAKEQFEFSETNLKLTQIDYNRVKKLSKDSYASKQRLDSAEIALEKAKNDFSQAELNMKKSKVKVKLLRIQCTSAVANHAIAIQEEFLAKRNLKNTVIRSPIDGIIGNSSLEIGNYVRAGIVLFSVIPEAIFVEANFKETQIAKFSPGMEATLIFDAYDNYEIKGKIKNIAPATGSKFSIIPPANATGNFTKIVQRVPVVIDFVIPPELKNKLTPGMSTMVKIRTD